MDVRQKQRRRALVAERLEQGVQARGRSGVDQDVSDLPAADDALAPQVNDVDQARDCHRRHGSGRLIDDRRLSDERGLLDRLRRGRGRHRLRRFRRSALLRPGSREAGRGGAGEPPEVLGQLAHVVDDPVALGPDVVDLGRSPFDKVQRG